MNKSKLKKKSQSLVGIENSPTKKQGDRQVDEIDPKNILSHLTREQKLSILDDIMNQMAGSKKDQSPKFRVNVESQELEQKQDFLTFWVAAMKISGTQSFDFAQYLVNQVVQVETAWTQKPREDLVNGALASIGSVEARDGVEGMLAAQMVATHSLTMEFLRRAAHRENSAEAVDLNVNRATKFQRTFLAQLEALNRHRGKGQQKVTVEHVTVNQGGQAVIGTVERPGGGGGNDKK